MPIPYQVDSLDAVPESLRSEYAATDDGKFQLSIEGHPDAPANLKSALGKERDANRAVKSLGKTPEEFAALIAREADITTKSANIESLIKQASDRSAQEAAALRTELDAARASEHGAIRDATLGVALTRAKATAEGVDLLTERLAARIKIETVDGKRVARIMQADGKTPMAGGGPDKSATFADLVNEFRAQYPSLFQGSGNGGGGAPSKQGAADSKSISRKSFDALPFHEQGAKARAGIKIVD